MKILDLLSALSCFNVRLILLTINAQNNSPNSLRVSLCLTTKTMSSLPSPPSILPASQWQSLGFSESDSSELEIFQRKVLLRDLSLGRSKEEALGEYLSKYRTGFVRIYRGGGDWEMPFHDDLLPHVSDNPHYVNRTYLKREERKRKTDNNHSHLKDVSDVLDRIRLSSQLIEQKDKPQTHFSFQNRREIK